MGKTVLSWYHWRLILLLPVLVVITILFCFSNNSPSNHLFGLNSKPLGSRVAVCLVGGARRFELTGPSIVKNVLKHNPNSDLFLHSPLSPNAFKLSFLRHAPRIASVRIFEPRHINISESALRVLDSASSPNGVQGLLQYFNLVEGCLTLIQDHQKAHNFTYDWIVRTRVDGYWTAPLDPATFVPGHYTVPIGSSYGGLNDRLGIGTLETSTAALSRLSLIQALDSAGFRHINSETAFCAQLSTRNVSVSVKVFPFCVVSDRKFEFPPGRLGVPVASMFSGGGDLSGAYCRPCEGVVEGLQRDWGWIEAMKGTLELCDARSSWEAGWENRFDSFAGEELAGARKRAVGMTFKDCVAGFREMETRSEGSWDVPPPEKVCGMGIHNKTSR